MDKRTRLIFLAISFIVLLIIGRWATGSFQFITTQFWFTSGLFLLLLLSLIDQPNFSKDANIFINSVTAWMSLMLVYPTERTMVWTVFFFITTYLIISSYLLLWIRKKELKKEHPVVGLISRINREIGKPETLFSAFFIWGAVRQFGINSNQFDVLLLYWIIFMILNLPAIARAINEIFQPKQIITNQPDGRVLKLVDPKIVEVLLPLDFSDDLIGKEIQVFSGAKAIGEGIFIDERIISGSRVGKVVVTSRTEGWKMISDTSTNQCAIRLKDSAHNNDVCKPISVVDKGTSIDQLVFYLHPNINLQEGEIVYVENEGGSQVFFQIVSAVITEELSNDGNSIQSVKVIAGQLGLWDDDNKTFFPYLWVPPSGQLIYQGKGLEIKRDGLTNEYSVVGMVPNSSFPVHVYIEDIVTHNTAIIGVTGSGKSYLAFHLIESLINKGVKVMILDLTREHYLYLHKHNPFPLKQPNDVVRWLSEAGMPSLAIHQFATATTSFPKTTSEFTKAAFDILGQERLIAGKNLPARLCIVFEEAHSLIPEWNQVSVQTDKDHVNNTARIILQGRKFGLGSILITQRTANVTKTILNQCNTIFALQSFDQTGLEFLRNYMGDEYSGALSRLPKRQAILVGKSSSSQKPIIFEIDNYVDRWQGPETDQSSAGQEIQAAPE